MEGVKEEKKTKLVEIWRACRKIQAALFKYNVKIWDYFKDFDPNNTGLISESQFITVLGQLKPTIGLSEFEIYEITNYFRVPDGRVTYKQFCSTVDEDVSFSKRDIVTGLECGDPMHMNPLSQYESKRLYFLLTKIAHMVRLKDIVLMPYFQDYELLVNNYGCVTVAHLSRILHFLGIVLSGADFRLLLKGFLKDSYLFNYVGFVKNIEAIVKYLDAHRLVDPLQDIKENFPGHIIEAELPKFPRPDIGRSQTDEEVIFHSAFTPRAKTMRAEEILLRIQKHVLQNQIRVKEFFECFDHMKTGFVTKNQFERGLDAIGVSPLHRFYLSPEEIEIVCKLYTSQADSENICWRAFENDIEHVFTSRTLERKPYEIVGCAEKAAREISRRGQEDWHDVPKNVQDICENALFKSRSVITNRRLYLHPFFRDHDKLNLGYVSKSQAQTVIISNGILLSRSEFSALCRRFCDDVGFNYVRYLEEADPAEYAIPKLKRVEIEDPRKKVGFLPDDNIGLPLTEEYIVPIIGNIKSQVIIKRLRIIDFMKGFDKLRQDSISRDDFARGLETAGVKLKPEEVDLLCRLFKTPLKTKYVDYRRFCDLIAECEYQKNLERAPMIVPLKHFPSQENYYSSLNFEERTVASRAIQKLATKPDMVINLRPIFQEYDKQNCGRVTPSQFQRALTQRSLHYLLSTREFETLCKCFAIVSEPYTDFDYRSFLQMLDVIYANKEKQPL